MIVEEIEKVVYGFFVEVWEIDINYSFEGGIGVVVELYVVFDEFMIGLKQIVKGLWVFVMRVFDEVWEQIKVGIIIGYSMVGIVDVYEEELVEKVGFFSVFKQMLVDKIGKEIEEMRKEDMKELFEYVFYFLFKWFEWIEKNIDMEEKLEQMGDDECLKKFVEDMFVLLIE